MPFSRWECLLYSVVSIVPFIFLFYKTFKDRFRYSVYRTILALIPFTAVQVCIQFAALYGYLRWIGLADLISTALNVLLLLIVVRDHYGRILFALLVVCNFSNLSVSAAKYVEGLISPVDALKRYHWTFSVWLLVFEVLILLFLWQVIFKSFRQSDLPDDLSFAQNSTSRPRRDLPERRSLWGYLWLVPATFYLVWMYMFYQGGEPAVVKLMHLYYLLVITAVDFGFLLIYGLVIRLVRDQEEKLALRSENYRLELQTVQNQYISERIEQTRRLRHDLRHYLSTAEMLANIRFFPIVPVRRHLLSRRSRAGDRLFVIIRFLTVRSILIVTHGLFPENHSIFRIFSCVPHSMQCYILAERLTEGVFLSVLRQRPILEIIPLPCWRIFRLHGNRIRRNKLRFQIACALSGFKIQIVSILNLRPERDIFVF